MCSGLPETPVRVGSSTIHFGGVYDPEGNRAAGYQFPGLDRCIRETPLDPGFRVLLSHRPGIFTEAAKHGIDLVLAGHLHGGHIVMPIPGREAGLSVADMLSEYTYGWYQKCRASMFVSRGVGMAFLPWRICCSPEIAVIRLKPAQQQVKSGLLRKV